MAFSDRDQRGMSRAQRMLEEENRQLMQEVRLLRDQNRQYEDRRTEPVQRPHHVMSPEDVSQMRGRVQTDDRLTVQAQQPPHVTNPMDMSYMYGHVQTEDRQIDHVKQPHVVNPKDISHMRGPVQTDNGLTVKAQQPPQVTNPMDTSYMFRRVQTEDRLTGTDLTGHSSHEILPMEFSQMRERVRSDGAIETTMQFTQERSLSDSAGAGFHSPGIFTSDLTRRKEADRKKDGPYYTEYSNQNVCASNEDSTGEKLVATERSDKDSVEDRKEMGLVDKGQNTDHKNLHTTATKQDSIQEGIVDGSIDSKQDSRPAYSHIDIYDTDHDQKSQEKDRDPFEDTFESEGGKETDPEQRDMVEKLHKLAIEEAILDKENEKKAKMGAELVERLRQMQAKAEALEIEREKARRWTEMKQEEERREMRLQAKIKKQREDEEKIRMLQREEERLKKLEEMKREEIRRQQTLESKLSKQREYEERIRNLQEEEQKYKALLAAELEEQRRFEHMKANQEDRRKQDLQLSMLKQESDNFMRQSEMSVVRPKEKEEEQKVEMKQVTRVGLDKYVNREKQPIISDRDFNMTPHAPEQIHSERSEIELLQSRLVSLEKQLQQKEHSDSQYSSISSKTDELERKEAYLRDLEQELNRKEEEIRHNLKLGQTSEEKVKKDSDLKKEETAPITGFTPYCKVNRFSGIDPVPKSESSFEEWKIEIECMMSSKMYPDHVINQALRNSLTGQAGTVAVTLGPKVTCQEIIDKLESVFGNVATGASVMQEFYTASQKVDESVTLWGIRIEQIVQRAVEKGYISPDQKNIMLKDRFWWYLYDDDLRNTTKIYYVQTDSFDLLRRKVKAEEYAMTVHNRSKLPPPVKNIFDTTLGSLKRKIVQA